LCVGAIGFTATWLTVQSGLKQHPVYAEALELVRGSEAVTAEIGRELEPGFKVTGQTDEAAGTAEMTFSVQGASGDAGARVYAMADADEPSGWNITFLDVGIRTDAGQEKVVTLRDGYKPEPVAEAAEE
ncbi:unnamed protein product, partial [Ectocarpus fasciculatus]